MNTPIFLTLALTIFFISLFKPLAHKIKLIDTPNQRKQHAGEIPLTGGIAMFLAFVFSILTLDISLLPFRAFIAGAGMLVLVGTLDDLHELSTQARFIAQVLAAVIMIFMGKIYLHHLGNIFFLGDISLSWIAYPLTIFATVGFINAMNMLDGLDGLAGMHALVALCLMAFMAILHHNAQDYLILSIMIAAITGFLYFNFRFLSQKSALAFMGDAGSMFLGFTLCWFAISLSQGPIAIIKPVTMLWIFMIPLFDTIRLLIYRTYYKRSPFAPNRDHIHHILLDYGFSAKQTTWIIALISLISGTIGIFGDIYNIHAGFMFLAFIFTFIIFISFVPNIVFSK